jgi:hypothetical protein
MKNAKTIEAQHSKKMEAINQIIKKRQAFFKNKYSDMTTNKARHNDERFYTQ